MSTANQPQPANPQPNAANEGVVAELSDDGIHNLAGYFDVLIQMDFVTKLSNERNEDDTDLQNASRNTTQTN